MGIKEKLEAVAILEKVKTFFAEKKKLAIIIVAVIVIIIIALVGLAMLGKNDSHRAPIIYKPTPQTQQTPAKQAESADTTELSKDASEEEIEAAAQKVMAEIEMLTAKQEQILNKMEKLKRKLDISNETVEKKKLEIQNLNKQIK